MVELQAAGTTVPYRLIPKERVLNDDVDVMSLVGQGIIFPDFEYGSNEKKGAGKWCLLKLILLFE